MVAALGLSDDPNLLDAGRIVELFRAVNAGLRGVGLHSPVEVVVVGGAAIALQSNRQRGTYDVDLVRLVNVHPQLHILGWDPQRSAESGAGAYAPPPRDETPTVGVYSPDQDGP